MDLVKVVCMIIAGVLSLAFAVRLLALAFHTRGAPELLWGMTWLLSAVVNAFSALGNVAASPPAQFTMRLLVAVFYPLTVVILLVAVWRLFRAKSRSAMSACLGACAILIVCWFIELRFIGLDVPIAITGGRWSLLRLYEHVGMLVGLLWAAVEMWRHYRMFLRRWRIGLAPRLLGVRYLLWFVSAIVLVPVWILLWLELATPIPSWMMEGSLPLLSLVSIASLWVAFFPPNWLRQRLAEEPAR